MTSTPRAARPVSAHVPALDGLRGIALLGVLFFHANGALPGGYLGVDLFFVLSGFLITRLLLAEDRRTRRIDLGAFWARRARRLFPALLALMPAVALYARIFAPRDELVTLRGDALATLAYVANWRAIFSQKSYWQLFTAPSPLEHTWSLSIEEQFYLVWPVLVVLVLRGGGSDESQRDEGSRARRGALRVLAVSLVLAASSAAVMLALFDPSRTSRVYLGTDARAGGILLGAALAALEARAMSRPDRLAPRAKTVPEPRRSFGLRGSLDAVGVVAAVGLAVAWCRLPGESAFLYKGGLWLTELAALAVIACATLSPAGIVARGLSWRPLTLLGTVSYGVYLWHWPVNVALTPERVHLHGVWLEAVHFAVTFGIAGVSYVALERPILTGGLSGSVRYLLPVAVTLSVLFLVLATRTRLVGGPVLPPPEPEPAAAVDAVGATLPEPAPFQLLLVGDSTANSLGWAIRGAREPGVRAELRGEDGCTMLADTCGGEGWAQLARDVDPVATLVVLGGAFMHGVTTGGEWRQACHRDWDKKFETTLERRLVDLATPRGMVWAVTSPYALGVWESPAIRHQVDCINASIRKAAAKVPEVRVLELADYLCPRGVCKQDLDGVIIRPDGVHYSIDGGAFVARWVLGQVEGASLATNERRAAIGPPRH